MKKTDGFIKKHKWYIITITFVIVFICVISPIIFTGNDFSFQVLAACFGALLTMFITYALLNSQTNIEENKDKNIKIYENKINVYSEFISIMWNTMDDGKISNDEYKKLRQEVFNKLIFYLNGTQIENIKECIDKLGDILKKPGEEAEAPENTKEIIQQFAYITQILKNDIDGRQGLNINDRSISKLWSMFSKGEVNTTNYNSNNSMEINTQEDTSISKVDNKFLNKQAWHFNAYNIDAQFNAFDKGIYEIALCEYGEYWRTNLVQQVNKGDILFLFARGGRGYIGIYEIQGWRVFNNDSGEWNEAVSDEKLIGKGNIKEDLEKYDIYNVRKEDGITNIANVIVNPIVEARDKGVNYPGGVYRRTISRYDGGYAKILFSRFKYRFEHKEASIGEGFNSEQVFENINTSELEDNVWKDF